MEKIKRYNCSTRAASLIVDGSRVETSGLVATADDGTEIKAQTRSVLNQAEALFNSAGLTRENITRVQIWLADMQDFSAMNEVYDAWVDSKKPPVRACVGASLASDHYLIEIQIFGSLEI